MVTSTSDLQINITRASLLEVCNMLSDAGKVITVLRQKDCKLLKSEM